MNTIRTEILLDASHPLYASHFPGSPCTPGSLIIHGLVQLLQEQVPLPCGYRVRRFRFRRFLAPGRCVCEIDREPGGNQARCRVYAEGHLAVEGLVEWPV